MTQGTTTSAAQEGTKTQTSLFPPSSRVIYDTNPLIGVVCNIRFDPILRIEAQPPADFQEAIRDRYPSLREQSETAMKLPAELPQQIAAMVKAQIGAMSGANKRYDFLSTDDQWIVTLTKDSLSLTARSYRKWELFKADLELPMKAVVQNYAPAFFTRVSLRYQNLIQRSKLGLTGVAWRELLKPQLSGMMAQPDLDVAASQSVAIVRFGEERGQVRVQHGLVRNADSPDEECYLIDNEFYIERRIPTDETLGILDFFNAQSGGLFRWCIDTRLDNAMGPQPVE